MSLRELLRMIRGDVFRIITDGDDAVILYHSRKAKRPVPEWMNDSLVLDYTDDGHMVTIEI